VINLGEFFERLIEILKINLLLLSGNKTLRCFTSSQIEGVFVLGHIQ
jgi:hypothetical protein